MPERPDNLSTLRFRPITIDNPTDSVTFQSRSQFPLDGPHDLLDAEPSSHGTVYEGRTPDPAGVTEKVGPNVNRTI